MRAACSRHRYHQLRCSTRGFCRPRTFHSHVPSHCGMLSELVSTARQGDVPARVSWLCSFRRRDLKGFQRSRRALLRATVLCRMDNFSNRHKLNSALLTLCCIAGPMAAQPTISTRDSVARRIGPHSVDSTLIVTLGDGDYARFVVMHPTGVAIDIIKPNGERVGRFIAPEDAAGADAVEFVAEGAGPYAVAVGNTADTAVHTTIAFQERLSLDERTRPVPWRDDVASPKIQEVRRQIDSGRTNTADFWSMVARGGTPLIEPLDARYDLVTFLWRAEHDTRNVYFIGSVRTPNGPNDALHQLGKTDIWYLTLPVPKGARFYYGLEPNRPSPGFARVTRQADPFNRGVKYDCGAGASKYECRSIGELPEAPLKPWIA